MAPDDATARANTLTLLNPNANRFREAAQFFDNASIPYVVTKNSEELASIVEKSASAGISSVFVCGGDGTVNSFLQAYMRLPESKRKTVTLGILPGGTANDLASYLGSPTDSIPAAYDHLMKGQAREIDVIRVNDKYFVSGGGLGFGSEVTMDSDAFKTSRLGKGIQERLGDVVFQLQVLRRLTLGYDGLPGVNIEGLYTGQNLSILSVQNLPVIGGNFHIAPGADSSDGLMNICAIPRPDGLLGHLDVFGRVQKGETLPEATYLLEKKITLATDGKRQFVGDGEMLCYDDVFKLEVLPRCLRVYG